MPGSIPTVTNNLKIKIISPTTMTIKNLKTGVDPTTETSHIPQTMANVQLNICPLTHSVFSLCVSTKITPPPHSPFHYRAILI